MDNNIIEIYEESEPEYKTVIYKKLFPVFFVFLFACIAASTTIGYTVDNAVARNVLIGALSIFFVASILVVFLVIMPKMRVKQARLDIKNYDFTPYVADGEEETFYCEIVVQINYFESSPFGVNSDKRTLKGRQQVEHYLTGLAEENRLNKIMYLDAYDEFISFYTYGTNEPKYTVDLQTDKDQTVVTIAEQHEATFTDKGLKIGGILFGYKRIIATAEASFSFKTYARIMLDCGNGIGASFAISPKILAVLNKFGVTVNDRFIADFILNDPASAFYKIAKLSSSNRIKKYALKFGNDNVACLNDKK